jgi:putative component of toxin-antitoxin plasmid stabilization module
MAWTVEFPFPDVPEAIRGLQEPARRKTLWLLGQLAEHGYRMPAEHAKPVGGGVLRLRVSQNPAIRLYYALQVDSVLILHIARKGGGQKGGKRQQQTDIDFAKERLASLRRKSG